MEGPTKGSALSVEVSAEGAKAHVGNSALRAIGKAAAWLMPRHDANVKLSQAMTERLTAKLGCGQILDEQEMQFLRLVFKREAAKLVNQADVVDRVNATLPEVGKLVQDAPCLPDSKTTDTFMRRAEAIAGDIHEEELRELFARVLAGEISKPGAFSIRTLETVRSLDPAVAAAFQRLRPLVFNGEWILEPLRSETSLRQAGVSIEDEAELLDAGLIGTGKALEIPDLRSVPELRCGNLVLRITFHEDDRLLSGHPLTRFHLTRTGRELASVLPRAQNDRNFFTFGKWFAVAVGPYAIVEWKRDGDDLWSRFDGP